MCTNLKIHCPFKSLSLKKMLFNEMHSPSSRKRNIKHKIEKRMVVVGPLSGTSTYNKPTIFKSIKIRNIQ